MAQDFFNESLVVNVVPDCLKQLAAETTKLFYGFKEAEHIIVRLLVKFHCKYLF